MGVSSWTRSKQGGESKCLTVEVSLHIAVKDTFLGGRERKREKGETPERNEGCPRNSGLFGSRRSSISGSEFPGWDYPQLPSGSELPGWDYTQSAQTCETLGKARLHAVAFRGHTVAGAGCICLCS